jgi:hypothetical protein
MHENRETSEAPAGNNSRTAGEGLGRIVSKNMSALRRHTVAIERAAHPTEQVQARRNELRRNLDEPD